MKEILAQAQAAIAELLSAAVTLKPGDMMVVGCSTSEICGQMIGTGSSQEAAQAVMDALLPAARERGLYLCVQCCEHLNRSLVMERACMEAYDLQQVWVRPQLHAGGAMALEAMARWRTYGRKPPPDWISAVPSSGCTSSPWRSPSTPKPATSARRPW